MAEEQRQSPRGIDPSKDYKAPTQSTLWQVIDVLFVLILCYVCLLVRFC